MFVLVTTIRTPNFMLVSKSAQLKFVQYDWSGWANRLQRLPRTRALDQFFLSGWNLSFRGRQSTFSMFSHVLSQRRFPRILGDPGADSGGERKSNRAGKNGTKKSKERREEPLGTMSYQTSSKLSPPFCLLIGQKNTKVFWHQSEARTTPTVWNWSGKTLSPGDLLAFLYFSSCHIFQPV